MTVCVRGAARVVVVGAVGVVVPAGVVVVVAPVQLPALQLSQQLGRAPTHAEPPLGAVHLASFGFSRHFVLPEGGVRQHATKPGLPPAHFLAPCTASAPPCFAPSPPCP